MNLNIIKLEDAIRIWDSFAENDSRRLLVSDALLIRNAAASYLNERKNRYYDCESFIRAFEERLKNKDIKFFESTSASFELPDEIRVLHEEFIFSEDNILDLYKKIISLFEDIFNSSPDYFVWRVRPEIERRKDFSTDAEIYKFYARFSIANHVGQIFLK